MELVPNLLGAWYLLAQVIFKLVQLVWNLLQWLKWRLDGTGQVLANTRSGQGRCAQVLDVWLKYNLDPISLPNTKSDFLLSHSSFESPEYVLKDEVSLYCMDENEAVFVEAPPGIQVWHNKYGPWHKLAQHRYTIKVIKMPISAAFKLVEKLPDPSRKLVFLFFIPRAGSTLIGNMFEDSGQGLNLAEPQGLFQPFEHTRPAEELDPEWRKLYLQAAAKLLCKPLDQGPEPVNSYFCKIPAQFIHRYMPMYLEAFPGANFLFLYRNGCPAIKSMDKAYRQLRSRKVLELLFNWTLLPSLWRKISSVITTTKATDHPSPSMLKLFEKTVHIDTLGLVYYWAFQISKYNEMLEKGLPVAAVKYEDLLEQPRESTLAILAHCGLCQDILPRALTALDRESQRDSPFSRQQTQGTSLRVKVDAPSKEILEEIQMVCRHFGIPDIYQDIRLANTITGLVH